jgi:NADPH:quinone reductase-like Zn-dependent oxidoreductase
VYGCSMFGAYSSRVLIPSNQLTLRPNNISMEEAAALPAVAGTALHALSLAGFWPQPPLTNNKAVLIHSAAGGVGLMLVQMAKILGCSPIVAVVGASHKVQVCKEMG